MKRNALLLACTILLAVSLFSCSGNNAEDSLKWSTVDSEYEGYPLRMEKPLYQNIFEYKDRYPRLVRVTLKFDSVMTNGWPEPEYEAALADFDKDMRGLFKEDEGIIFLIETFGAQRSYHYFVSDVADYMSKFAEIQNKYPTAGLDPSTKMNSNWEFLNEYPVKLY